MISFTQRVTRVTIYSTLVLNVCQWLEAALVVGARALVIDSHETIALEVHNRTLRFVDRELIVIDSKAVAVSVRVGEKARLQDRVGRRLKVGNSMRGRKRDLRY